MTNTISKTENKIKITVTRTNKFNIFINPIISTKQITMSVLISWNPKGTNMI